MAELQPDQQVERPDLAIMRVPQSIRSISLAVFFQIEG